MANDYCCAKFAGQTERYVDFLGHDHPRVFGRCVYTGIWRIFGESGYLVNDMRYCPYCGKAVHNKGIATCRKELLLTPQQAAEMLNLPVSTLHRLRRKNQGPSHLKFGKQTLRYPIDEILRFIENPASCSGKCWEAKLHKDGNAIWLTDNDVRTETLPDEV